MLEKLPPLDADTADTAAAAELLTPAQKLVERLNHKRRADLDRLRGLNRALEQALQQETLARERRQRASDDLEHLREQHLEAALEASGLLDAWVMPDGALLAADTWDRVLLPEPTAGGGLGRVLIAAVDPGDASARQVSASLIERILQSIGWGESAHPAWVDGAGRWRLGPLRGQWGKPQAEYLGRGAREAARRRRLRELAAIIETLQASQAALEQRIAELQHRRVTLDTEHRGMPTDDPLRQAHLELAAQERRLSVQRAELQRLEALLDEARAGTLARRTERDETVLDLSLPSDPEGLEAVEKALADYRASAGAYWPSLQAHWNNRLALQETLRERDEGAELLQEQRLEQDRLNQDSRAAAVEYATLRDSVGDQVAQLEDKLGALAKRRAKQAQPVLQATPAPQSADATEPQRTGLS